MIDKLNIMFLTIFLSPVCGQSMDPVVTITESSPPSSDYIIRGILTNDVWMNCYVENLPQDLLVKRFYQSTGININVQMINRPAVQCNLFSVMSEIFNVPPNPCAGEMASD